MSYHRGFKTKAERLAAEVRSELGLDPKGRLIPAELAKFLEIPIFGLRELSRQQGAGDACGFFLADKSDSFSALTIFSGSRRVIFHNDAHAPTRQASNITHEISHCVLEHPPTPLLSAEGCRYVNDAVEAEATFLGAALLVPRDGLLQLAGTLSVPEMAQHFGVSEELCNWRFNGTGVRAQLARRAAGQSPRRGEWKR